MRELFSKRVIFILLFMALAAAVTGACAFYYGQRVAAIMADEGGESFNRHYAFVSGSSAEGINKAIYDAAAEEAASEGDYLENMGSSLAQSYDRYSLMQLSIDAGVDGIIIEAGEGDEMRNLIENASEAGIPVITLGSDSPSSARSSYIGFGYYDLGTKYGKEILKNVSDEVSQVLVLMSPDLKGTGQNMIFQGIKETIETSEYARKFALETSAVTDTSEFGAQEMIGSLVMREEELPDIIVCLNELYTTCVCQALVDYNRVGETTVYGFYENETILSAIRKNIIYATVTVDTEQMGRYCIEALREYQEYGNVNEYMPADIMVITADNLDEYLQDGETGGAA